MAQYAANTGSKRPGSPWAYGWTLFAGIMMVISGIMDFLYGITAAAHNDLIVTTRNYAFRFNVTTWGWIHIVLGVLLVVVGAGVLMGLTWARWTGIFIVGLASIGNFMSLPYQPGWALVLLAIDVFVIWGLATSVQPDEF
ncbi:MAG: hypothetical protein HOW97_20910 [Catenulispora sp.]|nr:hypothetical protein [Catenulispora sp.]